MSFGNSASTVRQFKRTSSGNSLSPQDSIFDDSNAENKPPPVPSKAVPAAPLATKEAVLGRRCFAKAIDPALQEAHAAVADAAKRDALARLAEAWSNLDSLDPDGELLLLKTLFTRVQADLKLAGALLPQSVANAQLASLRLSKSPHATSFADKSLHPVSFASEE